ncbi:MAG: BatA domain-containing protein [Planctomycetota bacterium]
MTFVNASLLLGGVLAAVPILLHLISRQPPRRERLPTIRFLQDDLTTRQSKLRVRRWWLLALRVLCVLAIVAVLSRPMIASTDVATWSTIGVLLLTAIGVLVLASIAWIKRLGAAIALGLAFIAVSLLVISMGWSARTLALSPTLPIAGSQPVAVAILIDNAPSSAWRVATTGTASSNRLSQMRGAAGELIDQLPAGSRACLLDRSATPVSFSIDLAAARLRLSQISLLASPISIADRIRAAAIALRASDLPSRHIVVISDRSKPSWENTGPQLQELAQQLQFAGEGIDERTSQDVDAESFENSVIGLTVVDVLASNDASSLAPDASINFALSPPKLVDSVPASRVPIPISVEVALSSELDEPTNQRNATLDLLLMPRDRSLPVVRDGVVVRPEARRVDRVSLTLTPGDVTEIVLNVPPLDVGVSHAVLSLAGDDAFPMDNTRYLTIDLPPPARCCIVGDDADEASVLSAAITAPLSPDDPQAAYQIATIQPADVAAIDLDDFESLIWIDPPVHVNTDGDGVRLGWTPKAPPELTLVILPRLEEFVGRGGGLLWLLGPSADVSGDGRDSPMQESKLIPGLKRRWRTPSPGDFLTLNSSDHPIFEPLSSLQQDVPWSDFRITRHWQMVSDGWSVLASMASSQHPAVVVNRDVDRRLAVWATPLPALNAKTRSWNDLFVASDAWPAFVTVRAMAAWLSGLTSRRPTVLAGEVAVVGVSNQASDGDAASQLFPPGRSLPIPVTRRDSNSEFAFSQTDQLGTYFVKQAEAQTGYSVNLPPKWSDSSVVSDEQWTQWVSGDPSDQSVVTLVDEVGQIDWSQANGRRGGTVSLHGPLMLVAMIAFVLEQLLANWFYRSRGPVNATDATLAPTFIKPVGT